ncbi:hypothetical protein GIX82_11425 [Lactobacillus reuteri]|nr:hypothetical protein [Limosilactobacillus reuteri]
MNDVQVRELEHLITGAIAPHLGDGASVYSGDVAVTIKYDKEKKKGKVWVGIPEPSPLLINDALMDKLTTILTTVGFPIITVFPPDGLTLVDTHSNDIATRRALEWDFIEGAYTRVAYNSFDDIHPIQIEQKYYLPLMSGYNMVFDQMGDTQNHTVYSGPSGSGKSVAAMVMLSAMINPIRKWNGKEYVMTNQKLADELIVISPKNDKNLYDFCQKHGITPMVPASHGFVTNVIEKLNSLLELCQQRQAQIIKGVSPAIMPYKVLYLDEGLYLSQMTRDRKQRQELDSMLTSLLIIARSAKVIVVITSQTMSDQVLNTSAREQLNNRFLFGNPNGPSDSTRFLFKNWHNQLVIHRDEYSFGTGIASMESNGSRLVSFLSPFIKEIAQ